MKAMIIISKDNRIADIPRLKQVKEELKTVLPDLLPELTKINSVKTMANNGNWDTLELGNVDIITDVKLELVMCREMPLICTHFWVNGFIDHKWAVCHIQKNQGELSKKMKEFPLVKGGCNHSAESVEFSAGALGGCVVAAAVMLLIMMF